MSMPKRLRLREGDCGSVLHHRHRQRRRLGLNHKLLPIEQVRLAMNMGPKEFQQRECARATAVNCGEVTPVRVPMRMPMRMRMLLQMQMQVQVLRI